MIALVDCNSFFCSVEKVFHPGLDGKPVCVMSNNDGCIVALTPEAKALGLHRGDPVFKVRGIVEHNDVKLFSTNMYLYSAMSKRINSILRSCVNRVEQYSCDESFCYLDGYDSHYDIEQLMRQTAQKIRLYTDIPVSVGIASSKTLAKMGSKFAKQYKGYHSVCTIDSDAKRRKALEMFDLGDVWGISKQTAAKLKALGVNTPLEFADRRESWVRNHFNLTGLKTWKELNGIPCIDTREIEQRQSICTSRSFSEMVSDRDSLAAAVSDFAASSVNKLRAQGSVASSVTVFILSNWFREDLPQYCKYARIDLPVPTADTIEVTKAALSVLYDIYRPGIKYKKAGVILTNISDATSQQLDLFDAIPDRCQRFTLMQSIDELNHRFGLKKVRLAVTGEDSEPWHSRSCHRSGNYLSDINDILTIRI